MAGLPWLTISLNIPPPQHHIVFAYRYEISLFDYQMLAEWKKDVDPDRTVSFMTLLVHSYCTLFS